ncbi:MAG TPA: iron-containing alcohol dehydrogenase [Candidatus Limnocylindrales bacterium]
MSVGPGEGDAAATAVVRPFVVGRTPHLEFGAGRLERLPAILASYGERVLLVTGAASFRRSPSWPWLLDELDRRAMAHDDLAVSGEPSPDLVDEAVGRIRDRPPDVVVGIGGGSVLDAAKAVAGLLLTGRSVRDHLEGVGPQLPYEGPAVPFVAVPTTAGTGSEATRNAVLSEPGPGGFKKSFRDERLVAQVAIVDPDLLRGCPPRLIATDGLDALTQLLESYVSTGASPFTDALARAGLAAARDGLLPWHRAARAAGAAGADSDAGGRTGAAASAAARAAMAWAAYLGGVCLAQAGLGAVHGLASPLGARFPIPHGAACGATLVAATAANLAALAARDPDGPALRRYAEAGRMLAADDDLPDSAARTGLLDLLTAWTAELDLARLADFGVGPGDVAALVAESRGSSMRTNPIVLTDDEVAAVVRASL